MSQFDDKLYSRPRFEDTSSNLQLACKGNQEGKKHSDRRPESEDVVRVRAGKRVQTFRGGSALVQGLGNRNGRLALHFPLSTFFQMTTGSRVDKSTESIVSQNGSPTKHLTRHREWTEAHTGGRRAGVVLLTERPVGRFLGFSLCACVVYAP